MAKEVLTNCAFFLSKYDLRGSMNEINVDGDTEVADVTTFGNGAREYAFGFKDVNIGAAGFYETVTDEALHDLWATLDTPLTIATAYTEGAIAYVGKTLNGTYNPVFGFGEPARFNYAGRLSGGGFGRGALLANRTATATGNGIDNLLQAIASGKTAVASLHVTAASAADTLDVVVQSDDNGSFSTPTVRATFAQATVIGSQLLIINGPITDDHWRAVWTIGGTSPSFTFAVGLGFVP